ncbi:hypothetical protein JCM19239_3197 [Vibrio variabilis]|uniref:Uncharacterized protein n=1 Tax=Vibrio variabilis TaxID=990271 RepID=A0ABQ0JJM8_9VIBR|nr:hypothetical protein JCM19239_3197 [Vibrio variabilis]
MSGEFVVVDVVHPTKAMLAKSNEESSLFIGNVPKRNLT